MEINKKLINLETKTNEICYAGYKINGKKVYVKRIDIGNLPNATSKEIPHGLNNVTFEKIQGVAKRADGEQLILPFTWIYLNSQVGVYPNSTNIVINCGNDRSAYSGYVDVYFYYND